MPFRLPFRFLRPQRSRSLPPRVLDVNQMKRLVEREQARSDRTLLPVSLIRLEFEERQKDRSDSMMGRVYRLCLERIRQTDEIGEIDEHRIAILLPDTPLEGAEVLADDLRQRARQADLYLQYALDSYPLDEDSDRPRDDSSSVFEQDIHYSVRKDAAANSTAPRPLTLGSHERHGRTSAAHGTSQQRDIMGDRTALAECAEDDQLEPRQVKSTAVRRVRLPAPHLHFADELRDLRRYTPAWKRAIDITGAAAGLILLSPLLITTWLLVRLTSPGPGIFTQVRDGHLGKPFTIYKFRTMRAGAESEQSKLRVHNEQDGPAFKLVDDPRVTPIGALLRKTCIDELPQLWNVLRGEMSLVGPRPLPCDESAQCSPWQSRRLLVKPGLTCYWQTYRSNEIPFADWMRMDLKYAHRMSLRTDLQLVGATVLSIAGKRPSFEESERDMVRKENNPSLTTTS